MAWARSNVAILRRDKLTTQGSNNTSQQCDQGATALGASQKTTKRGRKANADAEADRPSKRTRKEAEPETEPRRSRRDRNLRDGNSSPQQTRKRGRKPKQRDEDSDRTRDAAEELEPELEQQSEPDQDPEERAEDAGRRRRQSGGGRAQPPSQHFAQLVPRTRYIPLATMANKWAPLEREAIAAVQSLLEECARPVISRVGANAGASGGGAAVERRQEQTRQAIASVTRRVRSKLVKGIPFPPGTVHIVSRRGRPSTKPLPDDDRNGLAADFNFERAVEEAHALEQQLSPLQHAVALLERERKHEEEALAADYAALRQLETNAQADLRTWRDRTRRAHVLAPVDVGDNRSLKGGNDDSLQFVELAKRAPALGGNDHGKDENENNENGQSRDKSQNGGLFEHLDKDLSTVAAQLSNHMDSLKSNLQQIAGVLPAMNQTKAALQHVLHQRLDAEKYERVILGP
ncbi:hypothetical protein SPBR_05756 [Sporothrix brasiliensis 5110]|uniref:Kinetochore protein fta7 n=1 Tax=Sporothrix brasiliensis 5110 TaxID=1398154 RepID=A0A0C2J5Q4_9PEZI|nr:uncharacterized protein SPBR_05756 [Sporothrix brasiliensis 5110]KIH94325.1 hypothetical protein SPBR_05756 [Sporothrix brasiliensis 5110]